MAEYNDAGNDTDPENVDGDDPARDAIQSKPVRYYYLPDKRGDPN